MALRRCALTLALVLGLAAPGSSLHHAGASLSLDECKDLENDKTQGKQRLRLECMDKRCGDSHCGTGLAAVTRTEMGKSGSEKNPLKDLVKGVAAAFNSTHPKDTHPREGIKGVVAPKGEAHHGRNYGFLWAGYHFPGQHIHEEKTEWVSHSITPSHSLEALMHGLAPVGGYTIDMSPFGHWGMKLIPYDFCVNEGYEDICEEGKLYHRMWTVASSVYAERVLDGGTFGIICNGENREHLTNGAMVKTEMPTIIAKLRANYRPVSAPLHVVVYNLMDVTAIAPPVTCAELHGDLGSGHTRKFTPGFVVFSEMASAVEDAGGTYQCFDCRMETWSSNMNKLQWIFLPTDRMVDSLHDCMHTFDSIVNSPAGKVKVPAAASHSRRWHLKRLFKRLLRTA